MAQTRLPRLTIIVAATVPGYGIGKGGALPWPMLKGEMGFFARVTKRVDPAHATEGFRVANAVIMGRKTWDSIPERFRPLKGRVNVVVSSSMQQASERDDVLLEGPYVRSSLEDALKLLAGQQSSDDGQQQKLPSDVNISRHFVIGGSSLYEEALKLNSCDRLLLTKIRKPFDCDVFFPTDPEADSAIQAGWRQRTTDQWAAWTGEVEDSKAKATQGEEQQVPYEFCLYERDAHR